MNSAVPARSESALAERYEALIRVSRALNAYRTPEELFCVLARELRGVVEFDGINIVQYDEVENKVQWRVLDMCGRCGIDLPPDFPPQETMGWWVYHSQKPLVIPFLAHDDRFPRMAEFLQSAGIQSICALPLTTVHRRLGSFGIGSKNPDAYSEEEVRFLSLVADQVALAMDDALNFAATQVAQAELQSKNDRLKLLLDVNNTVVSNLELRDLLRAISASVRRVMKCDGVGVALPDPESNQLRIYALDFLDGNGKIHEEMTLPVDGDSPPARVFRTRQPWASTKDDPNWPPDLLAEAEGIHSQCHVPLVSRNRVLGILSLGRREESAFTQEDVDFICQVAGQIAIAVENACSYREIANLRDQLAQEKVYLEDEIRSEMNFEEIVGRSAALRKVLQQVETVAPTDSTVLIYGETGTGKELIARAIHNLSSRSENAFVKLNCAAIPTGLLESELFGHEKGAFTGAVSQRTGRFELANRGTVFLDEVGEIPLELQPKLLRVLQEREFERLGSSRTIRTDARLIAASNRDLSEMVDEQKFRADLFYRLNVFPIQAPPLRERQEDIPLLVRHFVQQFARRMNKTIDTIPSEAMSSLVEYHWPGNIRELQNLIERAVILSTGPVLKVPRAALQAAPPANNRKMETLVDAERRHIQQTLEATNWVVSGPKGAAALLGMNRSTLQWRMEKLGLRRSRSTASPKLQRS